MCNDWHATVVCATLVAGVSLAPAGVSGAGSAPVMTVVGGRHKVLQGEHAVARDVELRYTEHGHRWSGYRLGDYVFGNPQYKPKPSMWPGSILSEYAAAVRAVRKRNAAGGRNETLAKAEGEEHVCCAKVPWEGDSNRCVDACSPELREDGVTSRNMCLGHPGWWTTFSSFASAVGCALDLAARAELLRARREQRANTVGPWWFQGQAMMRGVPKAMPGKSRAPVYEALCAAVSKVCPLLEANATKPGAEQGKAPGDAASIAIHLRIGDTLQSNAAAFSKHVPLSMYRGLRADAEGWAKAGPAVVTLYYDALWMTGNHRKATVLLQTKRFVHEIMGMFEPLGLTVRSARSGNTADQDVCEMLQADVFVPAGGGYTRLVAHLRSMLGRTSDLQNDWSCEANRLAAALEAEPDHKTRSKLRALTARFCRGDRAAASLALTKSLGVCPGVGHTVRDWPLTRR